MLRQDKKCNTFLKLFHFLRFTANFTRFFVKKETRVSTLPQREEEIFATRYKNLFFRRFVSRVRFDLRNFLCSRKEAIFYLKRLPLPLQELAQRLVIREVAVAHQGVALVGGDFHIGLYPL